MCSHLHSLICIHSLHLRLLCASSYDYRRSWACVLQMMLSLPAATSCFCSGRQESFFESPAGSRSTSASAMAHELPLELPSSWRSSTCCNCRSCCRCRCRRRCRSHRRRRLRRSLPATSPLPSPPPPPLSCARASVRLVAVPVTV